MNPTPDARTWIDAFASGLAGGWAGNDDAAVVGAANNATVANPAKQGTVPVPYTFAALLGSLSQASAANVEAFPGISSLYADILAQNSPHVLAAIQLMGASGRITSGEASAMTATVGATQPDPSYRPQIGQALANLGRPLDVADVAMTRNQYASGTTH